MEPGRTESEVLAELRTLRAGIPGLIDRGTGQAVSTGPLVPGCDICTRLRYVSVPVGSRCNASCPFCFVRTVGPDDPDPDGETARRAALRGLRDAGDIEGVALTGGEPLLHLDRLETTVREVLDIRPGVHLWIYTNGIIADGDRLEAVAGMGVAEIRVNLAATDYGPVGMAALRRARDLFEHVVVEVPSYPVQKAALTEVLADLDDIGIDQLNLQELLVTDTNAARLEGTFYRSGMFHRTRFFIDGSRRMTCEIMRLCAEEGRSFTVNDCSARDFGGGP